jgi:hypothetical protein
MAGVSQGPVLGRRQAVSFAGVLAERRRRLPKSFASGS